MGGRELVVETGFVSSAYAIIESLAFLIILGLFFIEIEQFFESLFFIS